MSAAMTVETADRDDARIVTVTGEIDLATAPQLNSHLDGAGGPERLIIDLSDVAFIDSTGLRSLILAREACAKEGRDLHLVSNQTVGRLLDITGLTDRFQVHASVEDALSA